MSKTPIIWACQDCGEEAMSWSGRCAACGAWNTLKEVRLARPTKACLGVSIKPLEVVTLSSELVKKQTVTRLATELSELDRVIGGGFFPGSVLLLAGEPGVGKSTLLLAIAGALTGKNSVLYVSGEESVAQIADRGARLGLGQSSLELVTSTDLGSLLDLLAARQPKFVIIDSIQTLSDANLPSAAGSLIQVRQAALALTNWAKATGTTLLLVGHVTKDGVAAGPRTLEHIVDVVLYLEGDQLTQLRLLRATKNRFGPTDEVGIFEMLPAGLREVTNPSARFLEHLDRTSPGSVATVIMEGRRPLVVEIQALTRKTTQPYPRRTSLGIDAGRLELILAVLEARAGLRLSQFDCFVNVSGGLKIREPVADVAVAIALASALVGRPVPSSLVAFGEIGLGGEIRPVPDAARRLEEARRLGFKTGLTASTIRAVLRELSLQSSDTNKEVKHDSAGQS